MKTPFVVIAGQFPPPMTGFAFITQEMAKLVTTSLETIEIDLSPHSAKKNIFYHLKRIQLTAKGLVRLSKNAIRAKKIFYLACDGGLGLVYSCALAFMAHVLKYRIYIHHHSFAYIEKRASLMAALLATAGHNATHIFLCSTMAERFTAQYGDVSFEVLSNSAFVDPPLPEATPLLKEASAPLVIGLLSNLNKEKGLDAFLEILQTAGQQGLNVKGILAGPPENDQIRSIIATASASLKDKLDYRGPVYGDEKSKFYKEIDVFVFPTRYANEAQPTVIFEALAHSVPVLSYDRGCILSQIGRCGAVQPKEADFIPFVLSWIKQYSKAPDALLQLKLDAGAAFIEDRARARQKAINLFEKEEQKQY